MHMGDLVDKILSGEYSQTASPSADDDAHAGQNQQPQDTPAVVAAATTATTRAAGKHTVPHRTKTYLRPKPAKRCHVCGRLRFTSCGNIARGTCIKSYCKRCAAEFGALPMGVQGADEAKVQGYAVGWECPHCRDACPQHARCELYKRDVARRRKRNLSVMQAENNNAPPVEENHPECPMDPNPGPGIFDDQPIGRLVVPQPLRQYSDVQTLGWSCDADPNNRER